MLIYFLLFINNILCINCNLNCLNGRKVVDWFIVYKLPLLEDSEIDNIKNGVGQFYMDNENSAWTYLENGIDTDDHPIYHTLQQIYYKNYSNSTLTLLYNDEEPDLRFTKTTSGHTKGILASDLENGFWIIHSVPKYPPVNSYKYPNSAKIFGQTLMCVSFNFSQLNSIGKQLRYNWPNIYLQNFPEAFKEKNSDIVKLLAGQKLGMDVPYSNIFNLKSSAGNNFVSFAKSSKFNDDLYSGLVAPKLFSSINVESWKNGASMNLPSNCSINYHVQNVDEVNLLSNKFESSRDHSKWAISAIDYFKLTQNYWICVGDINRQVSQMKRGGGTLCFNDVKPWKEFNDALLTIEACRKYSFFEIL